MPKEHLIDLDELILRCRSQGAKEGIEEAVACYRAGAFRSCIVATWNAIVWDYLDKLRFLDSMDDAEAKSQLEEWERAYAAQDPRQFWSFEVSVLERSRDKFQLISSSEYEDLMRLHKDRNRCAHPSFSRPEEIYHPTPELVRSHLRNAVEHFLGQPPVQGKTALTRLRSEVVLPSFPTTKQGALRWFGGGPLNSPRPSLVRDYVAVLMKCLLLTPPTLPTPDENNRPRWFAALDAVQQMHREIVETWWKDNLGDFLLSKVPEQELWRGVEFLHRFPISQNYWTEASKTRWSNYIEKLPEHEIRKVIPLALQCEGMKSYAQIFLDKADEAQIKLLLFQDNVANVDEAPIEVIERARVLWKQSKDHSEAHRLGRATIGWFSRRFTKGMVIDSIQAIGTNKFISECYTLPQLMTSLREAEIITTQEFDELIRKVGKDDLVGIWSG